MRTLLVAIILVLLAGAVPHCLGQIEPYAENPRYWQYDGEPVLLLGGSGDDNLFQWASDGFGDRLARHLDLMTRVGANYIRNAMNSRYDAVHGYNDAQMAYPFRRLDSGRYDLDQWNDDYWSRLERFLRETHRQRIFVQLELWDRDTIVNEVPWSRQPWNPDNNVNYSYDEISLRRGKTGRQMPFFEAVLPATRDPRLRQYQDRYIANMLEITLAYDHVLYQINNESPLDYAVSDYWASFIHDRARGRRVHVCDSRRFHKPSPYVTTEFRDWNNPDVHHPILNPDLYTYCDLSQNGGNAGQTHYDNLLWYRDRLARHTPRPINHVKVYTFLWPTGTSWWDRVEPKSDHHARHRFWRSLYGGSAAVRHHRDKGNWGLGLSPPAQSDIRSARVLAESFDFFTSEPAGQLLFQREDDEAYAMVDAAGRIAVYFTGLGDRSVEVDLASLTGRQSLRWLDVDSHRWEDAESPTRPASHLAIAPGSGQSVLLISSFTGGRR